MTEKNRSPREIDLSRLRKYRLQRVQAQLQAQACAIAVLFNPIYIRYATGAGHSVLANLHIPKRYAVVPVLGPALMFDSYKSGHAYRSLETVAEIRPSLSPEFPGAGPRSDEKIKQCVAELVDLARTYGGKQAHIAADRLSPDLAHEFARQGVTVVNAEKLLAQAQTIKSIDEVLCIRNAIAIAQAGIKRMLAIMKPGIRENQLWAKLHEANIALGGEWIETRMLSSGPRTNPWFQDCANRVIEDGDLVAFETGMIGPQGYLADISRTVLCGDGKASAGQRELYQLAFEQLQHNLSLLKAGAKLGEISGDSWILPERFQGNRYPYLIHGAGLSKEYPYVVPLKDYSTSGYPGVLEQNMVVCVESYIGAAGGTEGVKLEEQVLITREGSTVLSSYPFEERLLG